MPTPTNDALSRNEARGELFARCLRQYAEAMDQLGEALDTYRELLTHGPRWVSRG